MQLPTHGHPLHTRSLSVILAPDEAGRWCVRGDIIDLRKTGFVPMLADIQPAGIIHQMSIDLVVETEGMRIESLRSEQPFVAVEPTESSGGECCRDPAPRLQAMVGQCVDAEFPRNLAGVFGGALGCSHLLTLFQLMGSTIQRARAFESAEWQALRRPGERFFRRSVYVDGHQAEAPEGESPDILVGVQLADFHTRPAHFECGPLQRLSQQCDARGFARVRMPGMIMHEFLAAERERETETLASAPWKLRDDVAAPLVGQLIVPGLARRLFAAIGDDPDSRPLLDALLQLAPGHIQIMASVTERWFTERAEAQARGEAPPDGGPTGAGIGGMPDSCYMWRSGGAMIGTRKDLGPKLRGAAADEPAAESSAE